MDIPRPPKSKTRRYLVIGAVGVGAILVTVALASLEPAAPSVDRGIVYSDTVRRGTMLLQVRGPGSLVPEQIRWVSAVTAGRVERKLVQPGTRVDSGTVLLELSNPDVQLEALEAERQLTVAEAALTSLRATLETQRLTQEAQVATVRTAHLEAARQARVAEELARRQSIAANELASMQDRAREWEERLAIEERRLEILTETLEPQMQSQVTQVTRMRAVTQFQRNRVASMQVRAGTEGVLQDMSLEEGQWVTPGTALARVVQPERLKAVLRIPEVQARDVTLGQRALIDTRSDTIPGRVIRIDPAVAGGNVAVDVALEGELPRGARPDLTVDGVIELARLDDVLYVGRPAYGQSNSTIGLFRLEPGGGHAVRVSVRLGRASVNAVEVQGGLQQGDVVILSDMSQWDAVERVRLR